MSADKDKSVCDYNEFRKPWYFHGQLIDDTDFLAEQAYHASKRRLLNRMLHGSGVVCGLNVEGEQNARWIEVSSGLALDCCGNEIWVNKAKRFDISDLLPPRKTTPGKDPCEEPDEKGRPNQYYLGIRYEERGTDPVSVYLPGAGCEERTCENSRIKEGYCLELLRDCPKKEEPKYSLLKGFCDCQTDPKTKDNSKPLCDKCDKLTGPEKCRCLVLGEFSEHSVPCPECGHCDRQCPVILGRIELDEKGLIQSICINECREYVLTGRMVQHLIVSTFSGAGGEGYFKIEIDGKAIEVPSARELAHNPIRALAWILRSFEPVKALSRIVRYLIDKGELTAGKCKDLIPTSDRGTGPTLLHGAGAAKPEQPVTEKMEAATMPAPVVVVTREEHEEIKKRLTAQDEQTTRTAKTISDMQKQTEKRFKELDKLIQEIRKQPPPQPPQS